jgi:hypothetical protein
MHGNHSFILNNSFLDSIHPLSQARCDKIHQDSPLPLVQS